MLGEWLNGVAQVKKKDQICTPTGMICKKKEHLEPISNCLDLGKKHEDGCWFGWNFRTGKILVQFNPVQKTTLQALQ